MSQLSGLAISSEMAGHLVSTGTDYRMAPADSTLYVRTKCNITISGVAFCCWCSALVVTINQGNSAVATRVGKGEGPNDHSRPPSALFVRPLDFSPLLECDMEEFGRLEGREKTIAILGDRWWPQTAKQDGDRISREFYVIYGRAVMSAQTL